MKKYYLITYGCQMNKSDSERIVSVLEEIGYKLAPKIEEADLIVVNMCSVRQSAVDRVYGKIKNFAKLKTQNFHPPKFSEKIWEGKKLKTILTGCVLKEDLKKFRNSFDYILSIKNLPRWRTILGDLASSGRSDLHKLDSYLKIQPKHQTSFSAFVPIMTGCNNFCSYCVVPYVRGPEVSRPANEIICEAENLIKRKYKEIWLLGQNVNSYKSPICPNSPQISRINIRAQISENSPEINFPKLLRLINSIPGDFWVRFTSSHPKDFSDELIEAMADCQKVTEYLNLPVQSGDDEILRKMNRSYTIENYKNLVKKIREKIPNIILSTDVIVGFPGETKRQFENTIKLFKEIKFDMAYIAQYSPRPGTAAAKLKDDVPQKEKQRRWKVLAEVLKQTAFEKNKKYIGKTVEVLPEKGKNGFLIAKTRTHKTVKIPISDNQYLISNLVGQFVKVKIIDASPFGLKGKWLLS